ncbi:transporter substrate-binding domain-containing protein [Salinarimonas ramus]|uniref:Nopaline-binding periplasmic protein n=1 Tax=Salinarimonas ramus TaxID=690164 RepID=A0A917V6M0_9HYPH|nr:transporter substrate-binding domain-containing protein [Salinarimonas ramus]GGK43774.1 nopaline-binding periplasmic protein [Salinarimonas ramus]
MSIAKALGLGVVGAVLALSLAPQDATAQSEWETVRIATEGAYAPWNFSNPDGTLDGFEIELARDLCERMEVTCEIVQQDWAGIIPALQAGQYDAIMAGMNITDQREEVISFSRSYAGTPHGFAAMAGSPLLELETADAPLSLDDDPDQVAATIEAWKPILEGKVIGVQGSTTNSNFLREYLDDVIEIREYGSTEQHDLDLTAGRLDGIFAAHSALKATQQKPEFADMQIVGTGMRGGILGRGVAVGVRQGDEDLAAMFSAAIDEAMADGTAAELAVKWFGVDVTPAE